MVKLSSGSNVRRQFFMSSHLLIKLLTIFKSPPPLPYVSSASTSSSPRCPLVSVGYGDLGSGPFGQPWVTKKNQWCLLSWQWTKLTFDNKVKVHADAMEMFHFSLKWSSGYWEIDFKYQTFAEVVKGQVLSVRSWKRYFTLVCMPYLSSSNSGSLPYEYLILKIEGSLSKFADDITVSIPVHAEDSRVWS